jgi:hypothetical protein
MTDGPAQPESSTVAGVEFNVIWPEDAAAEAPVVTHLGIIGDGTPESSAGGVAGMYLVMGQVAPPAWFSPVAVERGLAAGRDVPVKVHAAVYLTRSRAEELYELLRRHLGKGQTDA